MKDRVLRRVRFPGLLLILAGIPAPALACTHLVGREFTPTGGGTDTVPPEPPEGMVAKVHRGGCRAEVPCIGNTCLKYGSILLSFPPASDDVSGADAMGYTTRIVAGTPPQDFQITEPLTHSLPSRQKALLPFSWNDGGITENGVTVQEPFDFTLGVRALDAAGNASREVTIRIVDPGRQAPPEGCGVTSGSPGLTALLLGLAVCHRRSGRRTIARDGGTR